MSEPAESSAPESADREHSGPPPASMSGSSPTSNSSSALPRCASAPLPQSFKPTVDTDQDAGAGIMTASSTERSCVSEKDRRPSLRHKSPRHLTESWSRHRISRLQESAQKRFIVLCAEVWQETAEKLESEHPNRFHYIPIDWGKFPDGTDNITISGFSPTNLIAGEHVLFLASFYNNDVTLSQFSVLIVLLQSFIQSMTIVLPYYPVGTNERVEVEGKVATANTYSILLSNLPSIGSPSRIMIYDIHALQNRFYFHNSTIPSLHSTIPLVLNRLNDLSCKIAFPDDGAAKRFGQLFKDRGFDIIVCGKVRIGDQRKITLASDPREIVGNECPFIC
jgi:phosphoribosylpyrophosphate synthetase